MSDLPKFTIITICLNESKNIRRTCESIASQTFKDKEWIVLDGASTDDTLEILSEFDTNITHLVSEPDDGIYHAMNKGIGISRGEYIIFMNGGDVFATNEALKIVAAAPQTDLIYGDIFLEKVGAEKVQYPTQIKENFLLKNMLPHQATFFRRELFYKFGIYDTSYKIAADYELYIRLLELAKVSHHHIAEPLAVFDRTGISSDQAFRALRKRENHRIRKKYFNRYRWSPKALRQEMRVLIHSIIKIKRWRNYSDAFKR